MKHLVCNGHACTTEVQMLANSDDVWLIPHAVGLLRVVKQSRSMYASPVFEHQQAFGEQRAVRTPQRRTRRQTMSCCCPIRPATPRAEVDQTWRHRISAPHKECVAFRARPICHEPCDREKFRKRTASRKRLQTWDRHSRHHAMQARPVEGWIDIQLVLKRLGKRQCVRRPARPLLAQRVSIRRARLRW